jgi:Lrp/AsnC family transcriptional regulator, leucine-responsive regulatory protein
MQHYCVGDVSEARMPHLDEFDRAILRVMQEDATHAYAEVGKRVNLSASAVLRRVQRMTANGIILATRTIVAPEQVGQGLTIVLEIMLRDEIGDWGGGDTRHALMEDPAVQQCYFVTGDTDLFVVMVVPNMEAFKHFTDRHFRGNSKIRKFRTSVVMDRFKSTTVVPV